MTVQRIARLVAVVGCLLLLPALAWAQATAGIIAGVVKDSSGAVMPGVTVEAASPALIEKVKSDGVDAESIRRARAQLRANHIKSTQTSEQIISDLATSFITTADAHFQDHYLDRIDQVTPQQLQDAARRYLDAQRLLTTAMLPSESAGAAISGAA